MKCSKGNLSADPALRFAFYLLFSYTYKVMTRGENTVELNVTQTFSEASGLLCNEVWKSGARLERSDGPAIRSWSPTNGHLIREFWYKDDMPHREDGPARIWYDEDQSNQVICEEWLQNGRLHRADGPAKIWYDTNTQQVRKQEYWTNGKKQVSNQPTR